MFWITKNKLKKSLEANGLVHDAIVMGIADKYIKEENLQNDDFELQVLGRALNWAVPNLNYNFENDLDKVENEEFKQRLREDEDRIFQKGLGIMNADPLIEQIISYFVTYELYLVDRLFPGDGEKRYPGIRRMKSFLGQMTEKEPDIASPDFKETYKSLFLRFNDEYGKYGKTLEVQTIDSLFSLVVGSASSDAFSISHTQHSPNFDQDSPNIGYNPNDMNELPKKGTQDYALANALSRPNAMLGLYKKLKFPLEWSDLHKKNAVYITHVVDLADRLIGEARENGKDLNDPAVQEKLQASFYGGAAGMSAAIVQHKLLRFLGFRRS